MVMSLVHCTSVVACLRSLGSSSRNAAHSTVFLLCLAACSSEDCFPAGVSPTEVMIFFWRLGLIGQDEVGIRNGGRRGIFVNVAMFGMFHTPFFSCRWLFPDVHALLACLTRMQMGSSSCGSVPMHVQVTHVNEGMLFLRSITFMRQSGGETSCTGMSRGPLYLHHVAASTLSYLVKFVAPNKPWTLALTTTGKCPLVCRRALHQHSQLIH
jgi:hypothetical protein